KVVATYAVGVVASHGFAWTDNVVSYGGGAFAGLATEGHIVDHARGLDPGLAASFVQQAFHEFQTSFGWIVRPGKKDLAGEDVVGLEARRNGHHTLKTESQETGPGQEHKCQGNLRDDEAMSQDLTGAAACFAAAL